MSAPQLTCEQFLVLLAINYFLQRSSSRRLFLRWATTATRTEASAPKTEKSAPAAKTFTLDEMAQLLEPFQEPERGEIGKQLFTTMKLALDGKKKEKEKKDGQPSMWNYDRRCQPKEFVGLEPETFLEDSNHRLCFLGSDLLEKICEKVGYCYFHFEPYFPAAPLELPQFVTHVPLPPLEDVHPLHLPCSLHRPDGNCERQDGGWSSGIPQPAQAALPRSGRAARPLCLLASLPQEAVPFRDSGNDSQRLFASVYNSITPASEDRLQER